MTFVDFIKSNLLRFQEILYAWSALQSVCNEKAMLAFKEKGFAALMKRGLGEEDFEEDPEDGRLIHKPTGTKFVIKTQGDARNLFQVNKGKECDYTAPRTYIIRNHIGKKTAFTPEEAKALILSTGCDYALVVNPRQIGLVDLNTIPAARFSTDDDANITLTVANNDLVQGCSVTFNFIALPKIECGKGVALVLELLMGFAYDAVKDCPMEDDVEITYPEKLPEDLEVLKAAQDDPARVLMCRILQKNGCFWDGPTVKEWKENAEKQFARFKSYLRPGKKTQDLIESVERLFNAR